MRLFIVSYQKSGTYQIMPGFWATRQIVGRAYTDMANVPGYGMTGINYDGISETCEELRTFENKAFGHLPYMPEYAEAIQYIPTKVLFNVRDPRDIVVANYHNIKKICSNPDGCTDGRLGHLNLKDEITGEYVIKKADPISALIEIESYRWPKWLGWLDHNFTVQVKYEDLRLNGRETLMRISEFLAPYTFDIDEVFTRMQPLENNPTFRAGRIGDWRTDFSPEHKQLAKKLLGETIERLGYKL